MKFLLNPIVFLRVSMGVMMFCHGLMKVFKGPDFWQKLGGMPPLIPEIPVLELIAGSTATLIELVGAVFVIIGYRVKYAALAIASVMGFAFLFHLQNVNGFESFVRNAWPLEIGLVFVAIAFMKSPKK